MYCGGGSFTSCSEQVLHKELSLLPSCSDSILSGLTLPLGPGAPFRSRHPNLAWAVLQAYLGPVLWYTCSFTVSPGWSPVSSVAPDWNPGWAPNLIHHFALPGAADETLLPSPLSARILQGRAWWMRALLVLGSPWAHSLPPSWCSSIPAAPWN